MPQHDMIVDNAVGATVRADINSAFAALVANNSGAAEPATMYAYMWWADTTTGLLKQRNAANTAWLTRLLLSEGQSNTSGNAVSVYGGSSQTGLTSGVAAKVSLDTEVFDLVSKFDSTTNYRWTPEAGYYQMNWVVYCLAGIGTMTEAQSRLYKNGAWLLTGVVYKGAGIDAFMSVGGEIVYANGTDYFEVYGYIVGTMPLFSAGSRLSGALIRR